ncbi:MAG: response regulator [Endomicrobiales bacterium]|nr:response regulator [Endomicrobiales bacterium]
MIRQNKLENTTIIPYSKCKVCGRVFIDDTDAFGKSGATCCGAEKTSRQPWPSYPILKTIELAVEQDIGSSDKFAFKTVITCAAVELLLETIMSELTEKNLGNMKIWEFNGGFSKNYEVFVKIFNSINSVPLDVLLEAGELRHFSDRLKDIFLLRKKIIEANDYSPSKADRETLDLVSIQCLKAFALINNSIHIAKPSSEAARVRKSILIVDDEPIVRDCLSSSIKRQGYNVYKAGTGYEAIRLFSAHMPDCVFLDVCLPDLDGTSILEKLKEINPEVKVYFVTGVGGEAFEKAVVELGACGCISKPIEADLLLSIIKNV